MSDLISIMMRLRWNFVKERKFLIPVVALKSNLQPFTIHRQAQKRHQQIELNFLFFEKSFSIKSFSLLQKHVYFNTSLSSFVGLSIRFLRRREQWTCSELEKLFPSIQFVQSKIQNSSDE